MFVNAGVNVLRIGLHASEALSEAPFGPVHPAVGELAEGLLYRRRVAAALAGRPDRRPPSDAACPARRGIQGGRP